MRNRESIKKYNNSVKGKARRKLWLSTHVGRMYKLRHAWKQRRDLLYFYLKNKPCAECAGWYEPCQMQFDHIRGIKTKTVAQLRRGSLKKMLEEIKKCDVVCANCHALRTFRRAQHANKVHLTWDFGRDELQARRGSNETRVYEQKQLSNSK